MEANFQEVALSELLKSFEAHQKPYLSIEEAASYLDISKSCLYKKTSNREIPFFNPGGKKIYFKREDLNQWIESAYVESAETAFETIEASLQKGKGGWS